MSEQDQNTGTEWSEDAPNAAAPAKQPGPVDTRTIAEIGEAGAKPTMHSVLRPNYRRARALALALEIEAARVHLDEARGDPSYTLDDIEDLKAELHHHLEREFSLTGVTSEYDL